MANRYMNDQIFMVRGYVRCLWGIVSFFVIWISFLNSCQKQDCRKWKLGRPWSFTLLGKGTGTTSRHFAPTPINEPVTPCTFSGGPTLMTSSATPVTLSTISLESSRRKNSHMPVSSLCSSIRTRLAISIEYICSYSGINRQPKNKVARGKKKCSREGHYPSHLLLHLRQRSQKGQWPDRGKRYNWKHWSGCGLVPPPERLRRRTSQQSWLVNRQTMAGKRQKFAKGITVFATINSKE